MRRRRAPRPLATAVGEALEQVEPATLLAAVQSAWPSAVGEAIAREGTPVAERSGVVIVACKSSAWAEELDLLGPRILAKIRPKLPPGTALEALRFTTSADPH
jgi:predicted nucleic acid-binding Zn ribbon protein